MRGERHPLAQRGRDLGGPALRAASHRSRAARPNGAERAGRSLHARHRRRIESRRSRPAWACAWDRPLGFTRDFVDGLQPLLAGGQADVDGTQLTTHSQLNIAAPDTPILLAALGPKMLELAGRRVQGTTVGQCGPRTIASYVAPSIRAAAEAAGRPEPRIMALIRICVTDDHAGAYALAVETARRYRQVPSYAAVQDMEGLDDPAELHLIGTWERVLDGLGAYAEAGVTDFRLEVAAHDADAREATRAALAGHLGGGT